MVVCLPAANTEEELIIKIQKKTLDNFPGCLQNQGADRTKRTAYNGLRVKNGV